MELMFFVCFSLTNFFIIQKLVFQLNRTKHNAIMCYSWRKHLLYLPGSLLIDQRNTLFCCAIGDLICSRFLRLVGSCFDVVVHDRG